jgi:hypothetical protein
MTRKTTRRAAQVIQFDARRREIASPPSSCCKTDLAAFRKRAALRRRDPDRWERWRDADRHTRIRRACLDFVSECNVDHDTTKSLLGSWASSFNESHRWGCVCAWREAVAQQLLTPAPTRKALNWKRRQKLTYLPVRGEDVERAIAADEAYLAPYVRGRREKTQ